MKDSATEYLGIQVQIERLLLNLRSKKRINDNSDVTGSCG